MQPWCVTREDPRGVSVSGCLQVGSGVQVGRHEYREGLRDGEPVLPSRSIIALNFNVVQLLSVLTESGSTASL
jgi:hypothetical protein